MTIRTIVLQADQTEQHASRTKVAGQLASIFDAHVHGVYIAPPASYAIRAEIGIPESVWSNYRTLLWEGEAKSKKIFESVLTDQSVKYSWSEPIQNGADGFCHESMFADMLVIGQTSKQQGGSVAQDFTDEVILKSRKPCVVVPSDYSKPVKLDRVLIAWNGSAEAARAIRDSFPILEQAKHVGVIQFAKSENAAHDTTQLLEYLKQHDIETTEKLEIGIVNIGQQLISHANDQNYDLLVLGAYGRTRIREIIMGGATRKILESSKGLVMLSH